MGRSIAEYLKENGYVIGKDVVPVKETTLYKHPTLGICPMKPMRKEAFCCHEGLGLIYHPETKEYYATNNSDLINAVADEFGIRVTQNPICPVSIVFVDSKLNKAIKEHMEYISPERVEERRRSALRAKSRLSEKPIAGTLKDVIREAGFRPNDYVELKDQMEINNFVMDRDPSAKIQFPKEEEVSFKYHICQRGTSFIIGNTETHEAIYTKNLELVEAFREKGYQSPATEEVTYGISQYRFDFKDPKMDRKAMLHRAEVQKQEKQIKAEIEHVLKTEDVDRLLSLGKAHLFDAERWSKVELMKRGARIIVLNERDKKRRSSRNLTVTLEQARAKDETLRRGLSKYYWKKKLQEEKMKETKSLSPATQPKDEQKKTSVLVRALSLFKRNGR